MKNQTTKDMQIHLWYDEKTKKYVTGKLGEFNFPVSEALYSFNLSERVVSQKIARNLNRIK